MASNIDRGRYIRSAGLVGVKYLVLLSGAAAVAFPFLWMLFTSVQGSVGDLYLLLQAPP